MVGFGGSVGVVDAVGEADDSVDDAGLSDTIGVDVGASAVGLNFPAPKKYAPKPTMTKRRRMMMTRR